jgi:tetratricopeptide (TPR) repeat protein
VKWWILKLNIRGAAAGVALLAALATSCAPPEPAAGPGDHAPGAASAPKPSEGPVDDKAEAASLAKLEAAYESAKGAFDKAPKDSAKKGAYVAATLKLAYDTMTAESLAPKDKYPKALRLYRDVLKLEPKNAEAIEWRNQIEAIYTSMGRPIPQ